MLQEALATAADDDAVSNVMVFAHHPADDPAETKASQLGDRMEVRLIEKLLADFRAASDKGATMVGSHAQIADVRAFTQQVVAEAPESVEVGRATTVGGHVVQPSGVLPGSRVVPLAYPMSVHWSGDDGLAIGSGDAAVRRGQAQGKVAILDPVTRQLTGLRTGQVTLEVTNDSMRAHTGDESMAPVAGRTTVRIVAAAGPGARVDAAAPVFTAVPSGEPGAVQPVTLTNSGDRPLVVSGLTVTADRPGQD